MHKHTTPTYQVLCFHFPTEDRAVRANGRIPQLLQKSWQFASLKPAFGKAFEIRFLMQHRSDCQHQLPVFF